MEATETADRTPSGPGPAAGLRHTATPWRARILNIALQEFGENGYRGTSLARIAERAELTQAGLLHHFRSKQDLLTAVLDLRDRMDGERLRPGGPRRRRGRRAGGAGRPRRPQRAAARPRAAVHRAHRRGGHHRPPRARLGAGALPRADDLADHVVPQRRRVRRDPPGRRPGGGARQVLAMMDGLQLQWLLEPEDVDMAAGVRRVRPRLPGADPGLEPGLRRGLLRGLLRGRRLRRGQLGQHRGQVPAGQAGDRLAERV
ncbi:helix-turn-helix domain-containing protein [Yinghuangia aomiensis]